MPVIFHQRIERRIGATLTKEIEMYDHYHQYTFSINVPDDQAKCKPGEPSFLGSICFSVFGGYKLNQSKLQDCHLLYKIKLA